MSYDHTPIVDIFSDIVSEVQVEYDTENSEKPFYEYGHPLEIVNTLVQKTNNTSYRAKKFPMICLFQDFKETMDVEGRSADGLNLVICTDTQPTYSASDRYTNTFKTILYPLWDMLIKYMKQSNKINQNVFEYDKYDRLYWGKQGLYGNTGNIFNDYLDAIEIMNLSLNFIEKC